MRAQRKNKFEEKDDSEKLIWRAAHHCLSVALNVKFTHGVGVCGVRKLNLRHCRQHCSAEVDVMLELPKSGCPVKHTPSAPWQTSARKARARSRPITGAAVVVRANAKLRTSASVAVIMMGSRPGRGDARGARALAYCMMFRRARAICVHVDSPNEK